MFCPADWDEAVKWVEDARAREIGGCNFHADSELWAERNQTSALLPVEGHGAIY